MQSWAVPKAEQWEGPCLAKMKSSRCSWVCMIASLNNCGFTRFMCLSSFIVVDEGECVSHCASVEKHETLVADLIFKKFQTPLSTTTCSGLLVPSSNAPQMLNALLIMLDGFGRLNMYFSFLCQVRRTILGLKTFVRKEIADT